MSRAPRLLPMLVAVAVLASSCRREEKRPPDSAGATSAGAILHPHFETPIDRLLTDRHLDLYVKVRRAARDRSEADAARALGVDPDEFAWVRARIVEALVALDETRVREASAETYVRTIASLRQTLKSVRDPQTARTIEAQIAGLERERAGMRRPDSVPVDVAANARKVAERRAELEAALK
ncbi:MAG TPA: hypothetical protein VGB47_11540 [Thermoanaerobaculia bacterium]